MRLLTLQRSNSSGGVSNLDIEKAYNHINWGSLLAIIDKMGIGQKWIRWIKCCISI